MNITGGNVTATGGGAGAGIGGGAGGTGRHDGGAGGTVTISGGTVIATGGTYSNSTYGSGSGAGIGGGGSGESGKSGKGGTVTITGGTVTATGGADAVGIGGGDGNTDNGTLKVAAAYGTYSDDSSITDDNKYYSDDMAQGAGDTAVNITRNRYMVTQEDTVPQTYPLWVGSTRVNAQIAANITGGSTATASYNASTNTLTLNGANLSGEGHTVIDGQNQLTSHYAVLYNDAEPLNLVLSGTNSLACTGDRQGDVYFGIRSNGNLTISGTGSASVNGRDTGIIVGSRNTPADLDIAGGSVTVQQNKGDAFEIYGNMQIGEGAGTVIAETAGTSDRGIYVYGSNGLTVNGGSLTATGGEAGIRTPNGPVVIGNSCAVVAAGDTQGIEGTVKNAINGFGWTDVDGTAGKAGIPVNTTTGQTLTDFKKVQFPVDSVSYLDWDATKKELVEKTGDEACKTYTVVTADTTTFEDGKWYVVDSTVTGGARITVNGTANLILMDGATLNASNGINATSGTLNIFAQSEGRNAGALTASCLDDDAIRAYKLTINGGSLTATGGNTAVNANGAVTINGGSLTATGGNNIAVNANGAVTINGGSLTATGSNTAVNATGAVTINGGSVSANVTGNEGDGIRSASNVKINGGSVTANFTGKAGDGIRSDRNVIINGGSVTASGNGAVNKSGICATLNLTISNGAVVNASGFGHGLYSGAGTVIINGGSVEASGSSSGIFANNNAVIYGGIVIVTGDTHGAFYSDGNKTTLVENAIPGTGWSDTAGIEGEEDIAISDTAQPLTDFKKVRFPAIHIHDNIDFTAWSSTDSLPDSGSWYLTADVKLSRSWHPDSDTDLCLNGKTITLDSTSEGQAVIIVGDKKTLNLYDEAENAGKITHAAGEGKKGGRGVRVIGTFNMYGGTITGNNNTSGTEEYDKGGGVIISKTGTFNMHGGTISRNTAPHGGGVYVNGGSFNQSGGTISGNNANGNIGSGGGVYVYIDSTFNLSEGTITGNNAAENGGGVYLGKGGTFKLSGSPTITGNLKNGSGNNVCLETGKTITVTDALTDGASIGVTMRTPGVITTGATFETDEAAQAVFFSDSSAYYVGATSGKQAQLMHNTHSYSYSAEGATVTATCTAAGVCSLPEIGGGKHGATLTINEPTLKTYGQTGQGISPEVTITDEHGIQGQATVDYYNTNDAHTEKTGQPLLATPTDAGTYWVEITLGSGNNTATAHLIYTIAKADSTAATVSYSPIVYDESAHPLVTVDASTLVGGEMRYALGTATEATGTYSADIPTATNAGTYYVWYKVEGDANHNDTEPVCVPVTIGYSITYDANGGTGAPAEQSKVKDVDIILATEIPTRDNNGAYVVNFEPNGGTMTGKVTYAQHRTYYSFLGWNTEKDGSGTSYAPGAVYTANESATLYAQWAKSGEATASIPLPTPVLEGYVFQGWTLDPEEGTVMTGRYKPEGATTLYALWKIGTYTVSFDTDGGTEIAAITGEYGTPITTVPEAPTKRGYTFKSWDKPIPETIPGEDMVIKAIYEALPFGEADFILPASLTVIEEGAFEGAGVKTVYVPETVERIEANAFRDCAQLEKLRLPRDCEIDDTAFDGCKNLLVYAPAGGTTDEFCDAQGILFVPEPAK